MKILVATDGSEAAMAGVRLARALPWPADTIVRVVSAVDIGTALFGGPWPATALNQAAEIESLLKAGAERAVEAAVKECRRPGLSVEGAVLEGRPAQAISQEASRFGPDLMVVGARGHGAIERMLLGSVSAELLDIATVPVLVARAATAAQVVLAWDGSPAADAAASLLAWPVFHDSRVRVVTVAEAVVPWWAAVNDPGSPQLIPVVLEAIDEARAERRRLNEAMVARLRAAGLTVDGQTVEGDPGGEVLRAAEEVAADLIVMGTHGRTGLARIALGSVARNVVSHARCSVLVVRGAAPEPPA